MKQVEFSKSARSSSILSGDMPGKLKSPQIIRRSAASVPRVARSEPNSSRNTDLLDEGGRYIVCQNDIPGFQTDIYQLELKRCVGNVVIPR